jgi:hypothetical protein
MAPMPDTSNRFFLEMFDCTLWCPTAQAPFHVRDVDALRSILGLAADQDPTLEDNYLLNDEHIAAIVSTFDTFDPRQFDANADLAIWLSRSPGLIEAPYLVHTRYELPLLLDDRKKLARFMYAYPREEAFDGEEAFDRWVANGVLHKEVVDEPFEEPIGDVQRARTVYYTPKGEEWRVPALKLINKASDKSGGWNEHFERLEGMLFGYEDWQNDWWIKTCLQRGVFGAATYCCVVTSAGLAWTVSSGIRALPPIETCLLLRTYPGPSDPDLEEFMREVPDGAAVLRFSVAHQTVEHIIDRRHRGPWKVQGQQIPELNGNLKGAIAILAQQRQSD